MRFWLVHSSEVSLHEQIVRQVTLGVLTGELIAGEKLPSIRELARRFGVHSNTVSGAYRQLYLERWVEHRRGSGVYIRARVPGSGRNSFLGAGDKQAILDSLVQRTIATARELGFSDGELQSRIAGAIATPARHLLLEPDPDLAKLVQFETRLAGCLPLEVCSLPTTEWPSQLKNQVSGYVPVTLPSKAEPARDALSGAPSLVVLKISPVTQLVAQNLPVSRLHLVGIASHWKQFLEVAKAMLIATGFSLDVLLVRDANERGWSDGLEHAASVVCDSLTATMLPPSVTAIVFPLLSRDSFDLLRRPTKTVCT